MDLKKLGLRIKDLRKKKKLTQDELSELSEMNGKHLGEVERGIINISIQNLDKIAESLGVPLLTLLEIEHHKSKEELAQDIAKMVEEASQRSLSLKWFEEVIMTDWSLQECFQEYSRHHQLHAAG